MQNRWPILCPEKHTLQWILQQKVTSHREGVETDVTHVTRGNFACHLLMCILMECCECRDVDGWVDLTGMCERNV